MDLGRRCGPRYTVRSVVWFMVTSHKTMGYRQISSNNDGGTVLISSDKACLPQWLWGAFLASQMNSSPA